MEDAAVPVNGRAYDRVVLDLGAGVYEPTMTTAAAAEAYIATRRKEFAANDVR